MRSYLPILGDDSDDASSSSLPSVELTSSSSGDYTWSLSGLLAKIFSSPQKNTAVDRIFNRGGPFSQSTGEVNIHRKVQSDISHYIYRKDWFHTIVDSHTMKCLGFLIGLYAMLILAFAVAFYCISMQCDCGIVFKSYLEAVIFTMEAVSHELTFYMHKCICIYTLIIEYFD